MALPQGGCHDRFRRVHPQPALPRFLLVPSEARPDDGQEGRRMDEDLHGGGRDGRAAAVPGPPGPRSRAGRPDGHPVREQAGVGHGRLRRPSRRGRHRARLHLSPPRPSRLHPGRRRGQGRRLLGPRPVGQGRGRPRRAPGARAHRRRRGRSPGRDARPVGRRRDGAATRRGGARAFRAGGRRRPARRHGLHHLHLGDDGPAQGRHAQPRQLHEQRRVPDRGHRFPRRRHGPVLPAPVPRLSV